MLANRIQKMVVLTGFAVTMGVAALDGSAIAVASSGGTVVVSPGTVDSDGTQGSFVPAMQGQADSDGDQDAYANNSWEAVPQDKPHTK